MNGAIAQLKQDLMEADDIDVFLHENAGKFDDKSFQEHITEIYGSKNISKSTLAQKAGISEVFVHQIFSGTRFPSRNKLICLCVGMGTDMEQCNKLLVSAGYSCLIPIRKRDCIIAFGLLNGKSVWQINDKLDKDGEETII